VLGILRRIVQDVNDAADLTEALQLVVTQTRRALAVDVCSIYLRLPGQDTLVLMATEGLNPDAVYRVRLDFTEGLVGLVAQRAEPVNLDDAPAHRRYKYFPETGEERYHAFLGVPVIHHRQLQGVLVVQQREHRRFDDEHVAFLLTLAAQLAAAIGHAEMSGEIRALREAKLSEEPRFLSGVPGANGVGIGEVVVAYSPSDLDAVPERDSDDPEGELARLDAAAQAARADLIALKDTLGAHLPEDERALFDAYAMILQDGALLEQARVRIREGQWAEGALAQTVREHARRFASMEDEYLRERATDIRDLGRRVLAHLQSDVRDHHEYPARTVLIGEELTAAQLAEVPTERLVGLVSAHGSGSSHVAILARALGVPATMGVADLPVGRLEGREVVVDGYVGRVYIRLNPQLKSEFERLATEERQLDEGLRKEAYQPAAMKDGREVPVYANTGLLSDISPSLRSGADGIGLYRTEVPFMARDRFPGEEAQRQIYHQVLSAFAPRPVTLRTLDVGGDKPLPYFPVHEDNPFLGWRGIRLTLDHPEIFVTQLRGMLLAGEGLGNLRVLLPMVSSVSELTESLALLERARNELSEEGHDIVMPQVGVMVEVPSAVYLAGAMARHVDFLSIGSNDLIQYLLAVDRNNPRVAGLYHALHPAVLRALVQAVEGAHGAGKPVSVCGEMAGDPASALLLLGMGVDSLSVSAAMLPRIKWVVRSFSDAQARALAEEALRREEPAAVRALLNEALIGAGLGGLVRAGKT
jgi:phosphotransferase system enzyme I (PtsP)